jgi:serine/threonine protein phosphatase PrpC
MQFESKSITHVGLKRPLNEDSFCSNEEEGLFVVADGMGGHAHGEVASRLAVETIEEFIKLTSGDADVTWPYGIDEQLSLNGNRLKTSIRYANQKLLEHAKASAGCEGMATTVVAVLLEGETAEIAHVGDSRLYLIRDGEIQRLTSDHSWVNEQVLSGVIDSEQARNHPLRNVVTRALGGRSDLEVDVQSLDLRSGDRLLLCSDGLTTMLDDQEILDIVLGEDGGIDQADKLVEAANRNGGEDNITAILLKVN